MRPTTETGVRGKGGGGCRGTGGRYKQPRHAAQSEKVGSLEVKLEPILTEISNTMKNNVCLMLKSGVGIF